MANLNKLCGNGPCKSSYKWKSKICKLKPNFVSRDKIISTSSKKIFDYVVPKKTTYTDCNSPNVIYWITCNRRTLQYGGETVQKLNKRFNWHWTRFNQPGKCCFCRILSDHSRKGNTSSSVQTLKELEGNDRAARNALDASITSIRKQSEKTWMLKLRTIYPYGLNYCLGDEYKKENTHVLVYNKFPPPLENAIGFLKEQFIEIIIFPLMCFSLNWNSISVITHLSHVLTFVQFLF